MSWWVVLAIVCAYVLGFISCLAMIAWTAHDAEREQMER